MSRPFRLIAASLMLIATAALPLATSAQQRAADTPPNTIDILNDRGGNVLQAMSRRAELERYPGIVRIRGYCRSACTIYITMPNACLGSRATVGFHAPRIPDTTIIPPLVDQLMGQYYRGGIRDLWFGGWNRSLEMHKMSAQDYVRLDPQTKLCSQIRR